MKKLAITGVLILILFQSYGQNSFFDKYDLFLKKYTHQGNLDFNRLKNEPELLNDIYNQLATVDLKNKSDDFVKAFLINAYNVIVIKQEQVFYPIKTPKDISGFFDNIAHTIGGEYYTLERLEKEKLLQDYPDPRVHLVLVCGAKGCPKLSQSAYRPENLNRQLDSQVTEILNDPEFLITNNDNSQVSLSKIFEWYYEDFKKVAGTNIIDYINKYRDVKLSNQTLISYYEYDWSINQMASGDEE